MHKKQRGNFCPNLIHVLGNNEVNVSTLSSIEIYYFVAWNHLYLGDVT